MARRDSPFGSDLAAIPNVRGSDEETNRFQQQLLALLNPILQRINAALGVVPVVDKASLPLPSAKYSRRLVCVSDDGRPEEVYVCLRTSKGTYEWARIAIASV